ncbi:glycosyltransferase [Cellulomonas sp. P5_E12]
MTASAWRNLVVLVSGVSWDDSAMSEKRLALALSAHAPVLFVDPPMSVLTPLRKRHLGARLRTRLQVLGPGLARLTPLAPPGVSRPGLRRAALVTTRSAIRRAVRTLDADVHAIVVASFDDLLDACPARIKVLWGTDDWVAGASLMGLSADWLRREEARQLAAADLVVAVSPTLAERWAASGRPTVVIPNGCDAAAFARADELSPPDDVRLPAPVAGFIGHLSARIDIGALEAVAASGHSLLLVGPRSLTFDLDRMDALLARDNVQWTGPRPFEELPAYMSAISVGLTPYADTAFNRSSYPLKTMEYLAAGRQVVTTDLPASREIPAGLATLCAGPDEFARATLAALETPDEPGAAERRRAFGAQHSWDARAEQFAAAIGLS